LSEEYNIVNMAPSSYRDIFFRKYYLVAHSTSKPSTSPGIIPLWKLAKLRLNSHPWLINSSKEFKIFDTTPKLFSWIRSFQNSWKISIPFLKNGKLQAQIITNVSLLAHKVINEKGLNWIWLFSFLFIKKGGKTCLKINFQITELKAIWKLFSSYFALFHSI